MLLANSLRAGSSFLQSVEMVVREAQPPISTEFGRVIREVNLGLPLDDALANLSRRVRSDDLDLMTTAIAIHHSVGGNLAEILDSIAYTIRERVRIKGEIQTLTAQQRMSGYVVGFLPVALVLLLSVIAPTFMEPMFQKPPELLGLPAGFFILGLGGFMMAHRLHPHPPHRRHRGLAKCSSPLVMAALAAFGVLARLLRPDRRAPGGPGPGAPVASSARCRRGRSRKSSSSSRSSSARCARWPRACPASPSASPARQKVSRTEKRLAMAGNPGDLRTVDFLGLKLVVAAILVAVGFFVSWPADRQPAVRHSRPPSRSARWASSCPRSGSADESRSARSRSCSRFPTRSTC